MLNNKSSAISRRNFLIKTGMSVAGAALTGNSMGMTHPANTVSANSLHFKSDNSSLKKGDRFNESFEFADKMTGRLCRQLTQYRPINYQPTYHLNHCFSKDSRYMMINTVMEDGSSALIRAEVETGEMTVLEVAPKGVSINSVIVQRNDFVAVGIKNSMKTINLNTLEERVFLKNSTDLFLSAGSIDGTKVFVRRSGEAIQISGVTARPVIHLMVDIATGNITELHKESVAQCNHIIPCPTDPDLLLIDRDFPPGFGGGGDKGKTTRVWILNIKTGDITEIRPNDPNRFQIHSNWNYNGEYVYYHGTSIRPSYPTSPNGHFIGVADKNGKVIWEGHFPTFFYGHVSSHTRSNMIITDGLFTKNLITAIHWEKRNSQNIPEIEILAQHDSNWVAGQNNHPHPHVSPDGKWLSYNRGKAADSASKNNLSNQEILKNIYGDTVGLQPNRSDVCVVML
jgi:hypothetical protein